MMLRQELFHTTPYTRLLTGWQPREQVPQIRSWPASALAVLAESNN